MVHLDASMVVVYNEWLLSLEFEMVLSGGSKEVELLLLKDS